MEQWRVAALMRGMKIPADALTGPARRASSSRSLPTMRGPLADPVAYFAKALRTELEHGSAGAAVGTDVTRDNPVATARIVAAHLFGVEAGEGPQEWKAFPAYYDFLWWIERTGPRRL